jgi:hypothetical protein
MEEQRNKDCCALALRLALELPGYLLRTMQHVPRRTTSLKIQLSRTISAVHCGLDSKSPIHRHPPDADTHSPMHPQHQDQIATCREPSKLCLEEQRNKGAVLLHPGVMCNTLNLPLNGGYGWT